MVTWKNGTVRRTSTGLITAGTGNGSTNGVRLTCAATRRADRNAPPPPSATTPPAPRTWRKRRRSSLGRLVDMDSLLSPRAITPVDGPSACDVPALRVAAPLANVDCFRMKTGTLAQVRKRGLKNEKLCDSLTPATGRSILWRDQSNPGGPSMNRRSGLWLL